MTRDHNLVLSNPDLPWPAETLREAQDAYDAAQRAAITPDGWRTTVPEPESDGPGAWFAMAAVALGGVAGVLLTLAVQWVWP